jgi:nicotinamidase-related amidase
MIPRRQKRDGFDDTWVAGDTKDTARPAEENGQGPHNNPHLKGKHLFSVGTFEHEILESLAPKPGELVLNKNSSSIFNSTDIDQLLKNLAVDTLVVVGGATDMCVLTSSLDAADRGYNVVVAEDCTCTFNHRNHVQALSVLSRTFAKVESHDTILEQLMGHASQQGALSADVSRNQSSNRGTDPFGNIRAKI